MLTFVLLDWKQKGGESRCCVSVKMRWGSFSSRGPHQGSDDRLHAGAGVGHGLLRGLAVLRKVGLHNGSLQQQRHLLNRASHARVQLWAHTVVFLSAPGSASGGKTSGLRGKETSERGLGLGRGRGLS